MKKISFSASLALFVLILFSAPDSIFAQGQNQNMDVDPLTATSKIQPFNWHVGEAGQLEIKMKLPVQFHAYAESIKIRILDPDDFQISEPKIEPLTEWFDKFSKKNRKGIKGESTLKVHLEAPSKFLKDSKNIKLELSYQACSDQFCLFPTKKEINLPISLDFLVTETAHVNISTNSSEIKNISLFSSDNLSKYLGGNLLLSLFLVFIAGILTSFTPCIFPMIPITLAVLGNHSEQRTRIQNFTMSLFYVFGIATTYSTLGLIAASSGSLFGASLGNIYVLGVMCVIFLTMSLSMYGLFEIQMPAFIRNKFGTGKSKGGLGGAFLTGLFAGVVASPCVGPVLVAILTYVATSQSKLYGFLYLFTFALGLGMIFIALGLSNQFSRMLPRSGVWMNTFKFFLGTMMLSAFYYYLNLLIPERVFDLALGLGLVSIASVYGAFVSSKERTPLQHLRKGLMQAVLFVGFGYISIGVFDLRPYFQQKMMGAASINELKTLPWMPYSDEALAEAAHNKKPVIIDFWAEWCAACHEMEDRTFTNSRIRALADNYVLLKYDATKDSPNMKALKKRYNIQGLPTVLFISAEGQWKSDLTLTAYEKAELFVIRMENGLKLSP